MVAVAKNHDLSPKESDPLSYSSVQTQINAYRPIFMQMQRSTDEGKKYHALALMDIALQNTQSLILGIAIVSQLIKKIVGAASLM